MIDDEQITNAIKRLALSPDGRLLHLMLQRSLMETCPNPTASGALPLWEGGRMFAAKLKGLMDSSLAENTGVGSAESRTEQPIVIARTSGVDTRQQHTGARRRVPERAG